MTVDQFHQALHISSDQVRDLKTLTEALEKFDKELAQASPGAYKLVATAAENQLNHCADFVADVLGLSPKEAQDLILATLGGPGVHEMTTGTLALSYLIRRANS